VLLAVAIFGGTRERTTARERTFLWLAGVALAAHFATWIASLDYTTVAISTLLVALAPLWTTLYDLIVRRRRYPALVYAAFLAGIAGVALVTGNATSPPPIAGHGTLGAVLAIAGSAAIAAYFLLVRNVRDALSTRTIVTHTYSVAAIVLVLAAIAARQPPPPLHASLAWSGILAMALVSQLLGHTGMNAALRWFSPTTVSFSTLVEPVLAALLALALFGESLAPLAVLGAILLLGSIGVVLWMAPD